MVTIDGNTLDVLNERARFALDNKKAVVKQRPNGFSLYECRFVVFGVPFLVGDGMEVKYFTEVKYLEKYLDKEVGRNSELYELELLAQQARTLYGDNQVVVRKKINGYFYLSHNEHNSRVREFKFKSRHNDFNYIRKNSYVGRISPVMPTPDGFASLSSLREHLKGRAKYNEGEKQKLTTLAGLTSRATSACPDRHVSVVGAKRKEDYYKYILVFVDTTEGRNHPFDSPKDLELLLDMNSRSDVIREDLSMQSGMPMAIAN